MAHGSSHAHDRQKLLGKSDYEARAGLSTSAKSVDWLETLEGPGDGTVPARNIPEGAKRQMESVQLRPENELVYLPPPGRGVRAAAANSLPPCCL